MFAVGVVWIFMHDRPNPVAKSSDDNSPQALTAKQWGVILTPAVWVLALASAFFYMTRYAINSWGVFFLEAEKGYSTVEAGSIVSVNAIAGIVGTFFSGILSDKLFDGRRNWPALIFGVLLAASTALFVLGPANPTLDTLSMVGFGVAVGVLLVYLGGLMAVDICPKDVSGTALGVVGVASYIGAGAQDIVSGLLIDSTTNAVDGTIKYDFTSAGWVWIGAAVISLVLASLVWNVREHAAPSK